MNGREFKLGTFAKPGGRPFPAIVLDEIAIPLDTAADLYRAPGRKALSSTASIQDLLDDWDANFAVLQEMAAALDRDGEAKAKAAKAASLDPRPPVARPGKMFYAAQNFQEHVDEMIRAGMSPKEGPKFTGEKSTTQPYLFLKAPSTLAGANDDIEIPRELKKIDWEAEIACAIGRRGKRIKAERALDHVAGWMTTNDVSARDLQIRTDRPGLRSDWLNGKSHDKLRADGAVSRAARVREGSHEPVHPAHGERRDQAERQHLAVHLHARGADRIRLGYSVLGVRRHFRLRHVWRRGARDEHVFECGRCDGDGGGGAGEDAEQDGGGERVNNSPQEQDGHHSTFE
jgi:2-keto-4-pentenoate hydratase/2-oxohepta-3-ene-1,7-dioic acid hydratase in catechol pathway